jgi:hypothetical protein
MWKVMDGEWPGKPTNISDALWTLVTAAWGQDWRQRPSTAHTITLFPASPAAQYVIRLRKLDAD